MTEVYETNNAKVSFGEMSTGIQIIQSKDEQAISVKYKCADIYAFAAS
jgi:hypothetical protein